MAATKIRDEQLLSGASFIKKDGSVAFTGDMNLGTKKITNLGTPTTDSDAATKSYVDATAQGLDVKSSVRAATTANVTLSGVQTIDGIALSADDRVLVKDQTSGAQNGIYLIKTGAWVRASDADTNTKVTGGMFVFVEEGTSNADSGWVCTNDGAITLGTTALTFAQFSGAGQVSAGAGLTKTGNVIDVGASDDSVTVNADGIQVKLDSAGAITVGTGGIGISIGSSAGLAIASNALGAKLDGTSLSVGLNGLKVNTAKFIIRETPTGTINGVNATFNLANTPIAGTEQVYLNGVLQEPGASEDYTISGATITYNTAPVSGDRVRVSYIIA